MAMAADPFGLRGKRVAVVGAGGIGLACLRAFGAAGAMLATVDARHESLAEATDQLPGIATIAADVSSATVARNAITAVAERLGGLDVLVHAAGVNIRRPILEFRPGEWEHVLATNLSSAFYLGQAAGTIMTAQSSGSIIFISSVAGRLAHREHGPYAAAKSGLDQLMRVMAHEWAPLGVTVNAVAPGYTRTNLTAQHLDNPGVRDALITLVPAGRLGEIDDAVGPVLFLASHLASFITGQVIYVDGGRTLV
jgi:gluconate 5-dehydrogenase